MQNRDPGIYSNNIMFSESKVGQEEQLKRYTGKKNLKVFDLIWFDYFCSTIKTDYTSWVRNTASLICI